MKKLLLHITLCAPLLFSCGEDKTKKDKNGIIEDVITKVKTKEHTEQILK